MADLLQLVPHHVGCLTLDIEKSATVYENMGFPNRSEEFAIKSQQVKVCFVEIGKNFFLELVEFSQDNPTLSKIFKSNNPYYHLGYLVASIATAIQQLEGQGFYLVNQFNSEAFKGKPCAFLYSPEMHLIELIEI